MEKYTHPNSQGLAKKVFFLSLLLFAVVRFAQAQPGKLQSKFYYPKDSLQFEKDTDFKYHDGEGYGSSDFGRTTMIIRTQCPMGVFYFVFKKKIKDMEAGEGAIARAEQMHENEAMGKVLPEDDLLDRNLYAFLFLEDHGGLLEKARFQDFGNAVYWPQFDYRHCFVDDADADGAPEFYLSYMGDSDGLDAKPFKQIVYTKKGQDRLHDFTKAKATAFYPSGNEEDRYHIVYDDEWRDLPEPIRQLSQKILKEHRRSRE